MTANPDELSADQRLALAYGASASRAGLTAVFWLDRILGRAVASASQPLIGQVRLAWWREQCRAIANAGEVRDPCLISIRGLVREGRISEARLEGLVDSWEVMLDDVSDPEALLAQFGMGRGTAVFGMAAGIVGCAFADVMVTAGKTWALVDFARRAGSLPLAERAFAIAAETTGSALNLPRAMRVCAILTRFAERDISRGSKVPIVEGSPRRILEAWGLLIGRT
jgi:15-cis-phytoene synthase